MKSTLVVSNRGQITLPASMRKKMGIGEGGVVTVEETDGKLVLSPAVVMEVEMYTDEQIRDWMREDAFAPGEREKLTRQMSRRGKQ